jgi:hypothetical protein
MEEQRELSGLFYEVSIILVPKQDKTQNKEGKL